MNLKESENNQNKPNEIAGFSKKKLLFMSNFCNVAESFNSEKSIVFVKIDPDKKILAIPFYGYENRCVGMVFQEGNEVTIAYRGTDFSKWHEIVLDFKLFKTSKLLSNKEGKLNKGFFKSLKKSLSRLLSRLKKKVLQSIIGTSKPLSKKEVRVYKGFYQSFKESLPSLEKALQSINVLNIDRSIGKYEVDKSYKINFTGHSLGGATTQIAALYFHRKADAQNISVATFGSPRVFSHNASKTYNSMLGEQTIRLEQDGDLVTGVPISLRFNHVGKKLKLSQSHDMHKIPSYCKDLDKMEESDFKEDNTPAINKRERSLLCKCSLISDPLIPFVACAFLQEGRKNIHTNAQLNSKNSVNNKPLTNLNNVNIDHINQSSDIKRGNREI